MAIEIDDLPIKNGDFPVGHVNVYQRVTSKHNGQKWPKNVTAKNHSKRTSDSGNGFSKIDAICAGGFRDLIKDFFCGNM